MTDQEALKNIVEDGIELGAGNFVDVDALKVAAKALENQIKSNEECDHDCAKCWKTKLTRPTGHDKWREFKKGHCEFWCSECGYWLAEYVEGDITDGFEYCPHCGAKMEKGSDA